MSDLIAVTGATGQLGRLVVAALRTRVPADRIVALVRSPGKAADLGVATRAFDYTQADALAPALDGVGTLLLISADTIGERVAQHRGVIAAARAAGVTRIAYTSLLHADRSPISLAEEHRATEADLGASGLAVTILRNGWYFENHTAAVPAALANGAWVGSAGEGRIAHATRADLAEAAAIVLTTPGHAGRTYELAGDSAHTMAELAAELSRQADRDIPYRDLPVADYAAILEGAGVPPFYANALAEWDRDAANGALDDRSRQLATLLGRATETPADAIRQALGR